MSDTQENSTLVLAWTRVANLLGLEIASPFTAILPSGTRIEAAILIKHFGARNGMLVIRDYSTVKNELPSLEDAGFGFCVLEDPAADQPFVLDEYVEVLRDWGWVGDTSEEPAWLRGE